MVNWDYIGSGLHVLGSAKGGTRQVGILAAWSTGLRACLFMHLYSKLLLRSNISAPEKGRTRASLTVGRVSSRVAVLTRSGVRIM